MSHRAHDNAGSTGGFSKWAVDIFLRKAYACFLDERVGNRQISPQKSALN